MDWTRKVNPVKRAKQLFTPKDPWRMIDGKVYNAKDQSWFQFTGRILEVRSSGILVDGDFGEPLEKWFGKRIYFVENFPNETYSLADGEQISGIMNFVAHMGGKTTYQFTNSTIDLRVQTVRRLDYGKIVATPPPDLVNKWQIAILAPVGADQGILDDLKANQTSLAAVMAKLLPLQNNYDQRKERIIAERDRKIAALPSVYAEMLNRKRGEENQQRETKALAACQELADKGDPIGLRRMGERYRDGQGVETDLTKANEYFKKADAAEEAEIDRMNQEHRIREQAAQKEKYERLLDSADKGVVSSMISVGKCYRDGIGVEKDFNKAREYFRKASNLGSEEAGSLNANLDRYFTQ